MIGSHRRSSWRARVVRMFALGAGIGLLAASLAATTAQAQAPGPSQNVSLFATGLDNPRGIKFGPDGNLYVAEGGRGGAHSTVGQCPQVIPPVGPYTSGMTGRISRISPAGVRTTVVGGLPSSQTSPLIGSPVSGVADVAFVGHRLYALLGGAGCSHGVPNIPNGVIRVSRDGTWHLVADLSAFLMTHPVKTIDPDDFEPDGTWYSMVFARGSLYAIEPNHAELDRIQKDGKVSRVIDFTIRYGSFTQTSMAFHHGAFYVGNLGTFPATRGDAYILRVTPDGDSAKFATGLMTVLGVAFDRKGRLYALENFTVPGIPGPGAAFSGDVKRLTSNGSWETVASGLMFPTAMTFGPDGKLYVSNFGYRAPPGAGQIVRIDVGS